MNNNTKIRIKEKKYHSIQQPDIQPQLSLVQRQKIRILLKPAPQIQSPDIIIKKYKQFYKITFTFSTTIIAQFTQVEGFPQHFYLPVCFQSLVDQRVPGFQIQGNNSIFEYQIQFQNAQKFNQLQLKTTLENQYGFFQIQYQLEPISLILRDIEQFQNKNQSPQRTTLIFDFPLFPHQQLGLDQARKFEKFAFLDSPGLGKSLPSLIFLLDFQKPILIIAPFIVHQNWVKTIKQLGIDFVEMSKKKTEINSFYALQKQQKYSLMDYSQIHKTNNFIQLFNNSALQKVILLLTFTEFQKIINDGLNLKLTSLLIDEFHEYKDITAKRTQLLVNFCNQITNVAILTATPALNNSTELYSILRILGLNVTMKAFQDRYAITENTKKYQKIIAHKNVKELSQILKIFSIRRSYDLLPIPAVKRVKFQIMIPKTNQLSTPSCPALLQLASTLPKLPFFLNFYKNFNHKSVVFFSSIQVADALQSICPKIDGRTSIQERKTLIRQFQDDEIQKIALSMECANLGFDLSNCGICFFLQLCWTAAGIVQAEGRIRRVSSKFRQILSVFVDGGSEVENQILNVIQKKGDLFEAIYGEEKIELSEVFGVESIETWIGQNMVKVDDM
eukprot:EST44635.1 SNF2 family N-terminal and Helicase conserved C-terminal domain-containing protein [Spironucleus salmonicida]